MAYKKELKAAKKAASLAAKLCKLNAVQEGLSQSDVESKSDRTPVTVADYDLRKDGHQETLRNITEFVNATLATDGTYNVTLTVDDVLSAIDKGNSEGGPHGSHWVLDPIDGPKGFIRGDQYAIALSLLDGGEVVLGILACPNLPIGSLSDMDKPSENGIGCLISAVAGSGPYIESLECGTSPKKISVCATENPVDASLFESFEASHSSHDLSNSISKVFELSTCCFISLSLTHNMQSVITTWFQIYVGNLVSKLHQSEWIVKQNTEHWLKEMVQYSCVFLLKDTAKKIGIMQQVQLLSQKLEEWW